MPRALSVLSKDKLQELGFGRPISSFFTPPPAASAASEARQAASKKALGRPAQKPPDASATPDAAAPAPAPAPADMPVPPALPAAMPAAAAPPAQTRGVETGEVKRRVNWSKGEPLVRMTRAVAVWAWSVRRRVQLRVVDHGQRRCLGRKGRVLKPCCMSGGGGPEPPPPRGVPRKPWVQVPRG